ncbi:hypothetical protein CROQUDRAFT_674140 [Cronartium quercuum f. sp. fusiforme G11]|uniref:Zn(2)-C6 fungal-type domain-containing protein n=1 Tax=Cronartium quercuum f. sp. fusiforme G11 TaxID=708437 RepID=A0A9P6T6V6_9BASI|nr:hypothetical protein CROQUDRAFT_674140 [Cronartium quercuum f. sp. fusiforme G11]
MAHTTPTWALLRQLEANEFLPAPSLPSTSRTQQNRTVTEGATSSKRRCQRVSRACDACRRMKIKCVLEGDACEACALSARPCTFEDSGTQRQKPPTRKDITDLYAKIESLEGVLTRIAPELDLNSLPRTAEQAQRLANVALSRSRPKPTLSRSSNTHEPSTAPSQTRLDTESLDEAVDALASFSFSPGRYLGSHSNLPFFRQPSVAQVASYDPDLDSMIQDPSRSLAERLFELRHRSYRPSDANLPPPDLAHSLIALYFSRIQPFAMILHREHFLGLYGSGMINKDMSFKALCYAVFAAASPHSNDPRVLCTLPDDEEPSLQTAGARYAAAAVTCISPVTLPCTLFELQTMAVLSNFYLAMGTPTTAWFLIGLWLRRAQDVGVHVEEMPRWCTSILKDQLRKRAFWYMVVSERVLCIALGRSSGVLELELTVGPPLFIPDDSLTEFDSKHSGPVTPHIREEYKEIVRKFAGNIHLACSEAYWGIRKLTAPYFYEIWSTDPTRIIHRPARSVCGSSKLLLTDLAMKVDDYIKHSIPSSAKWYPETPDDDDLIWKAYLHCTLLNIKVMTHRHLVNDAPHEIEVCTLAARSIIDIMDHVNKRGLLDRTASWSPYKIIPAGLICLYSAFRREIGLQKSDKLAVWADVNRVIDILKSLAPRFFLAQQLEESLSWLLKACIEDIFTWKSSANTPNEKKRRHDVEEPLPSEVLLRNIFASNQRVASSSAIPESHVPANPTTIHENPSSSPTLRYDVPTSSADHEPTNMGGSADFQQILDHLLSLPINLETQSHHLPQDQSVVSAPQLPQLTKDCSSPPNTGSHNSFWSDITPTQPFASTSNLPNTISDLHQTYPYNNLESVNNLPLANMFPAQSEAILGYNDVYVPPLCLDTSFFQLDFTPSFATVNFTHLPATSSPLRNTSELQDYMPCPPGVPQQTYIPPTSTQNKTNYM